MENHRLPAQDIPILAEVDVVIIGGTFAGLASALKFAKQGKRVMLVESRTYLGSELTATLSPWITSSQATMPRLIEACVNACGKTFSNGNSQSIVFHVDRLKLHLEEVLLAAGVRLLYASLPIGITRIADNCNGLIIANKSGRQLIQCQGIVDATETAIATFLNGEALKSTVESKKSLL
ncbi:hypothetical protein QF028_000442 [Neobacillus sp. B4I6]|uniref:FAD-dependent oxidoreductase n=1 Tax=Neobacillus sp. B4I6 TaxID=3373925 RepID=UPI003D24D32F